MPPLLLLLVERVFNFDNRTLPLVGVQSKSHRDFATCTRDFGHETLVSLVTRDQNLECEHENTSVMFYSTFQGKCYVS